MNGLKLVDSMRYHLWTDALHGRELAREANNDWDRGTYVRWTVTTAWSAFDAACEDALGTSGLGYRFRENLNAAIAAKGLPPIDWGSGLWQRVLEVYETRKSYVHVRSSITHSELLAPVSVAERVISTLREAIKAIYQLAGSANPMWCGDDKDRGWASKPGFNATANMMVLRADASEDDPDAVRIAYVSNDVEHVCEIAPAGTSHEPLLDDLTTKLRIPVSAIRAYRGEELIEERKLSARGA